MKFILGLLLLVVSVPFLVWITKATFGPGYKFDKEELQFWVIITIAIVVVLWIIRFIRNFPN